MATGAIVFHHNLNIPGGEATVAIETAHALHNLGYDVHLMTVQKPNMHNILKWYGKSVPTISTTYLFPFKINYFGLYQRLLASLAQVKQDEARIVISTNGGILPRNIRDDMTVILYMHFPQSLLTSKDYVNIKYRRKLLWRLYFKPYLTLSNELTKKSISRSNIILANSQFTSNAIKKVYPYVKPMVIYPPVNIDRFYHAYQSNSRERMVLVLSRFSPEKQIERAIHIAKILSPDNIRFKIMGSLLPSNLRYFRTLQKMVADYGLEKTVNFVPNATNHEIIDAMSTSMVYFHTMAGEHFGISIIEAMASGLVPVVPSFGGCTEIVSPNSLYSSNEDARDRISENIGKYSNKMRRQAHRVAERFSSDIFREKIQLCIQQGYSTNE